MRWVNQAILGIAIGVPLGMLALCVIGGLLNER